MSSAERGAGNRKDTPLRPLDRGDFQESHSCRIGVNWGTDSQSRRSLVPSGSAEYSLETEPARKQYGSTTSSAEDHSETTTAEVCIGVCTLGPVEGISKFSAKLKRLSFSDGKEFRQ